MARRNKSLELEAPIVPFLAENPASVFEIRKNELKRSKDAWRNLFILNIFFLLGIMIVVFGGLIQGIAFTAILWFGFALALPLSYSAIFFHAQHNREREFLEEYSFKSVAARSFEAYRLILKQDVDRSHPEEQKKFLDFVIDSAKALNMPPRAIISKHPLKSEEDVKIGVIEKLADVFKRFIPGRMV